MNGSTASSGVAAGIGTMLLAGAEAERRVKASCVAARGSSSTLPRCTIPPSSKPPRSQRSQRIMCSSR